MRFVMFVHSIVSDWNHGNAHFLRGVAVELMSRGHEVRVFEPADAWSVVNLEADAGPAALSGYREAYPALASVRYEPARLDVREALQGADVVLVHEWNDPELVAAIGAHRRREGGFTLFFHDTHHRSVTEPETMARYQLDAYDGTLAFGDVIARAYVSNGWTERAWTWHEAADVRVFHPRATVPRAGDLVWIGNWGDEERTSELEEYLLEPVRALGLRAVVYGVRYPPRARELLRSAGIEYRGWLPNHRVPEVLAAYPLTVHVPRRPYAESLPGIPTIRVFEALACGIALVTAPWRDAEGLFTPGSDFLVAGSGQEMSEQLDVLLTDADRRASLAQHGLETIRMRHTCAHRVDELLAIVQLAGQPAAAGSATA
jgi:spore maturation protein CgeB